MLKNVNRSFAVILLTPVRRLAPDGSLSFCRTDPGYTYCRLDFLGEIGQVLEDGNFPKRSPIQTTTTMLPPDPSCLEGGDDVSSGRSETRTGDNSREGGGGGGAGGACGAILLARDESGGTASDPPGPGDDVDCDLIRIPPPGWLFNSSSPTDPANHNAAPADDAQKDEECGPPSRPPPPPNATAMRWASGSCTICLGAYRIGESVAWSTNPECHHCFHTSCIEEWLLFTTQNHDSSNTRAPLHRRQQRNGDTMLAVPACPNCRREFVKDPYEIDV
jgi:hypothetical protein